ncbi:MAG TPA: 50S ribosomal protein L18 [Thermoanaerobaculia bacterium]|jgi:large subunit ribosomal protein L18|nr:50S ribosomal protein L18 [Thermoanaerobaculia bacterium]
MSDITKRMKAKRARRDKAHLRVRKRVQGSAERPRLSVYKSLRYIYAQVIDDVRGVTLAQANSSDPAVREAVGNSTAGKEAAKRVGELVAQRAKEKGVEKVVFDRGGYIYHGRVQMLAEAAREKGLQF